MSEAFLVRRSGGTGKAFAAISVTYPAGCVCTCSNGRKTLNAKDTSGACLFLLPETGQWKVSVRNPATGALKEETVNAAANSTYSLEIAFYTNIDLVTNGWANNRYSHSGSGSTTQYDKGTYTVISWRMDVTPYKTLYVSTNFVANDTSMAITCGTASRSSDGNLDISRITGVVTIAVYFTLSRDVGSGRSMNVVNAKLLL